MSSKSRRLIIWLVKFLGDYHPGIRCKIYASCMHPRRVGYNCVLFTLRCFWSSKHLELFYQRHATISHGCFLHKNVSNNTFCLDSPKSKQCNKNNLKSLFFAIKLVFSLGEWWYPTGKKEPIELWNCYIERYQKNWNDSWDSTRHFWGTVFPSLVSFPWIGKKHYIKNL